MNGIPLTIWIGITILVAFLVIRRQMKSRANKRDAGHVYLDIGWQYEKEARYNDALKQYHLAEKHFRQTEKLPELAKSIFLQALLYKRYGKYEKARGRFSEAGELCKKIKDHDSLAHNYINMGELCEENEQYNEAAKHFAKAAELWYSLYNDKLRAFACYRLGMVQTEQGEKQLAVANFDTALKEYRRKMDDDKLAEVLMEISAKEKKLGAKEIAAEHFREAEKLLAKQKKGKRLR